MKTKNLFSRFTAASLMAAALVLPALTSCSSEAEPNIPDVDPTPEGMGRISLSLSMPEGSISRAGTISGDDTNGYEIAADANEAYINSLWLYIFNVETVNSTSTTKLYDAINCKDLLKTSTGGTATDVTDWRNIYTAASPLNLPSGDYKFYMVANIADYLSTDTGADVLNPTDANFDKANFTEAMLDATLNFGTDGSKLPAYGTPQKGLPMAAHAKVVKAKKDNTDIANTDGVIHIGSGKTDITIEMTFLVAAVRYTILYDGTVGTGSASGVSQFYKYFDVIDENPVTVQNITPSYSVYSEEVSFSETNANTRNLTGMVKGSLNSKTPAQFFASPFTLTADANWSATAQRGYQGIVYLPENCATTDGDNGKKTLLTILYKVSEKANDTSVDSKSAKFWLPKVDEMSVKMTRGNFYDVMGTITTSGMDFQVKVLPWTKQNTQRHPID